MTVMPISGDAYKELGRTTAGAVSVVAAYGTSNRSILALTVSSFSTLSFEPPLVMFAIQHNADSYHAMVESKAFGVSLLSTEQSSVAQLFASKGRAKVENTTFEVGQLVSVPLIPNALAHIECTTSQVVVSGDHVIVIGLVEAARTTQRRPLLYFARQYGSFSPLE
jgi:flavin reductase (DIM6/NTAB) family NADH-FMN oxidoreductase RutF